MKIPIGHKNYVNSDFIIAILRPNSAPARRLRQRAEKSKMLLDATNGRKARSIIVLQSNHVVLSALQPATFKSRLREHRNKSHKPGVPEFIFSDP